MPSAYKESIVNNYIRALGAIIVLMNTQFLRNGLILSIITFSRLFGQSDDHVQESTYKPFRILIISPDSSKIDKTLTHLTDSIELEYREMYYKALNELEIRKKTEDDDKKRETEMAIQEAKWMEMEVYDFKYYQFISMGAFITLLEHFNLYPWAKKSLTCELEEPRWLFTYDSEKLTRYYDVDYIIYFQGINIVKDDDEDVLTMTMETSLFSRAESKNILQKETLVTSENFYCTLRGKNKLMCLLTNMVESSTEELITELTERQKK